MKKHWITMVAVAALGVSMSAAHAQSANAHDAGVTLTLSTTMQRTCTAALSIQRLSPSGQPMGRPNVVPSDRGLFAQPHAQGLTITQWAREPSGEGRVIATVSPDGEVLEARLVGSLVDAMQAQSPVPLDVTGLAAALARDIPERLVIGRTFNVGEPFYNPATAEAIVDQLAASMGAPFPLESVVDVTFLGAETIASGSSVYAFGGAIRLQGQGQTPNGLVALSADFNFRLTFDQATSLVLTSDNDGLIQVTVNGRPASTMAMRDGYTCEISPRG
jgi:hypothetical protein